MRTRQTCGTPVDPRTRHNPKLQIDLHLIQHDQDKLPSPCHRRLCQSRRSSLKCKPFWMRHVKNKVSLERYVRSESRATPRTNVILLDAVGDWCSDTPARGFLCRRHSPHACSSHWTGFCLQVSNLHPSTRLWSKHPVTLAMEYPIQEEKALRVTGPCSNPNSLGMKLACLHIDEAKVLSMPCWMWLAADGHLLLWPHSRRNGERHGHVLGSYQRQHPE